MELKLYEALKKILVNGHYESVGNSECCFCGCRAGNALDIPHESWCPMPTVRRYVDDIQPAPPRKSRKELKARIRELESSINDLVDQPTHKRMIEAEAQVHALLAQVDDYKARIAELEQRLHELTLEKAEADKQLQHNWKEDYIRMCNNCDGHMKRADDAEKQLAESKQAVRIVEALERMDESCSLYRRIGNEYPWCVEKHGKVYSVHNSIPEALRAAGLMQDK